MGRTRTTDAGPHPRALLDIELPGGHALGGYLLRQAGRSVVVLFADAPIGPGDVVTVPGDQPLTVRAVRRAVLGRQPVTALEVGG